VHGEQYHPGCYWEYDFASGNTRQISFGVSNHWKGKF